VKAVSVNILLVYILEPLMPMSDGATASTRDSLNLRMCLLDYIGH
jgi:hypothetical protein